MDADHSSLWRLLSNDAALALAVFAGCLALYLPTLAPSVVRDDGGEMQMIAAVLGVPHPTGYPLFTLLGWLFTRLPLGGDAAYRVSFLCAVAGAGSVTLLFLLIRELGVGRLPALAAAFMAAAAPRLWLHATAVEVYSLANFFAALGLWLLIRWGHGKTPLWVVALAFGFGLTHHISLRLFGPAVVIYILLVDRRLVLQPRRWLPALACLLLPLALYAYIPLRAASLESLPQWQGEILGVRKLVAAGLVSPHYFGGGTLGLALAGGYSHQFFVGGESNLARVFQEYVRLTHEQYTLWVIPLVLLGAVVTVRRRPRRGRAIAVGLPHRDGHGAPLPVVDR